MKNSQTEPVLPTENQFSKSFADFNNQRLFKRLQEKHRPKAFWEEHRKMYLSVVGVSYLFNILSALTAATLVFSFALNLTDSMTISVIITAVSLSALEMLKRETISKLFHNWFQFREFSPAMVGAVVLLSVISTSASYFGAEKTITTLSKPPQLTDYKTQTGAIEQNIAAIDEQIKSQSAKGTRSAQRTIEKLSTTKAKLTDELLRTRQRTDAQNEELTNTHTQQTTVNSAAFAYITLCCEICLILALIYLEYYDYRSFSEYATSKGKAGNFQQIVSLEPASNMQVKTHALNEVREPIGFKYGIQTVTQTVTQTAQRRCSHCKQDYEHGHARQKYCSDACRIKAWQIRTGRELFVKH